MRFSLHAGGVAHFARVHPLEPSLDRNSIERLMGDLAYRQVAVAMPQFEFESAPSLAGCLSSLGMTDPFSSAADFSGMTGAPELFIRDVIHKAFVSVDEAGTEAAAATAVIVARSAMPEQPVQPNIDRPFLFFIRDIPTNAFLFMGRVMNPIG